ENSNETSTSSKNSLSKSDNKIIELSSEEGISKVLNEFHNSPLGAHQGVMRTYHRLKKFYYFPKMLQCIKKFISKCDSCQRNKIGRQNKLPMTITTTSKKPFEKIFLDIVGPMKETSSGNKYILTCQDDLSKFSIAIPLENQEVETIARAFVKYFICCYGTPDIILTDQGSNFKSDLLKRICKLLRIEKIQTSAYHPQSNGALERSHRTLGEYLRNFTNGDSIDWDIWLPCAMFSYNSTPHTSSNYMPFKLLYGCRPNIPSSLQTNLDVVYNYDDYVSDLRNKLQTSYAIAKNNLIEEKQKSKHYYDKNSKQITFNVGDLVLLKNESRTKLEPLWTG
ncbi:MAG TPA: hypothetical protein DDZ41_08575, partial [Flavobacterium sp.]|nr:hypothetical protein [Flavobacterium sp.]